MQFIQFIFIFRETAEVAAKSYIKCAITKIGF